LRQISHIMLIVCGALAACQPSKPEGVSGATVTLPAAAGRPGVAYFTLSGGKVDARLMGVTSPKIIRIELHDSMMQGGAMTMKPLADGVAVPAGASLVFAPGGKHAMLFDIEPHVRPGDKLALHFTFADGHTLDADADVKAPGDGQGKAMDHAH
jgi:periplasmic copper chaperone A